MIYRHLAMMTIATAFAATGASAQTLRLGTVVSEPHPWLDAAEMFKEQVEAETDLSVEIFPGGQLGEDATMVDEMRIGTIDILIGGVQNISTFVPSFQFFSLNYLFPGMDAFRAATAPDSEIFGFYQSVVEEADVGLRLLAFTGGGTRNLSTSDGPITSPADLEGTRMRVTGSQLDAEMWQAVGAVTTSLPWTEIYTGVQTGVVDAFESTISGYFGSRLYEVAQYHNKTEHQIMMSHISISTQSWDRLTEEQRQVIEDAAQAAAEHGTNMGEQYDAELLADLEAQGVTVSEVDKQAFIDATAPLHEQYAERLDVTEMLQAVRDLQ